MAFLHPWLRRLPPRYVTGLIARQKDQKWERAQPVVRRVQRRYAPALVVGAGLTTGYLLKQAGRSVAVIDQNTIGGGETSHTTAHITFVTDARLHELASKLGKREAQAFWGAGYRAMRQIEEIVTQLKADCKLSSVPGYLFATFGSGGRSTRQ